MMLLRSYTHSWFVWFKREQAEFPNWFLEWFYYFGPTTTFLPQFAAEAYELFKNEVNFVEASRLLHFFANFGVTWIMT